MKRKRPQVFMTSMAALLAVIVVSSAGPVQAQQEITLVNLATNYCLDSDADGDVYTLECNGGKFQQWELGIEVIQNFATELCLSSALFGGAVYTAPCDGSDNQAWEMIDFVDGINFKNRFTGECLDSDTDQDVYTHRCNGGSFQIWR